MKDNTYAYLMQLYKTRRTDMNKVRYYLSPVLQRYGNPLMKFIKTTTAIKSIKIFNHAVLKDNQLTVVVGIYNKHRIDTVNTELAFIRKQEYYRGDFPLQKIFGKNPLHCINLSYPQDYNESFYWFEKGAYSRMYDEISLKKFFHPKKSDSQAVRSRKLKILDVLHKNEDARERFETYINTALCTIPDEPSTEIVLPENVELDFLPSDADYFFPKEEKDHPILNITKDEI